MTCSSFIEFLFGIYYKSYIIFLRTEFMQHLILFYFFITNLIGFGALAFLLLMYLKTGEKLIKYFLFFYSMFAFFIIQRIISIYLSNIIIDIPVGMIIFSRIINILLYSGLIFTVIVFVNHFVGFKYSRLINLYALVCFITSILYSGIVLLYDFTSDSIIGFDSTNIISDIINSLLLLYAVCIFFLHPADSKNQKIHFTLKLFFLFSSPLLFLDIFNKKTVFFITISDHIFFFPLFYCFIGIIFGYYIFKDFYFAPRLKLNELSIDEFCNKYFITNREKEILNLLLKGYTNTKISNELFISISTVKTHIHNIYGRTNAKSRYELIHLIKSP